MLLPRSVKSGETWQVERFPAPLKTSWPRAANERTSAARERNTSVERLRRADVVRIQRGERVDFIL